MESGAARADDATGIAPVPAILAVVGLVVLQILAAGLHLSRGEAKDTGLNLVLILLAGVAAWQATPF